MSWTEPRTWTAGELVTADMMNTHVRDNLKYLKDDHADVRSGTAVHGLAAGEYIVGCKQGARRIECKTGSTSPSGAGSATVTVTWDNAFTTIHAVATSEGVSGADIDRVQELSVSATQASKEYRVTGACSLTVYFIAIGED